jgi:hypothetical protein
MGLSSFDPAAVNWRPWNAARLLGSKRALERQQVWAIRFLLDHEGRLRDRALFDLAICEPSRSYLTTPRSTVQFATTVHRLFDLGVFHRTCMAH